MPPVPITVKMQVHTKFWKHHKSLHRYAVSRHVSKTASTQFKLVHSHSKHPCRYPFYGRGFFGDCSLPGSGKAPELSDLSQKQHDPAVKSIL